MILPFADKLGGITEDRSALNKNTGCEKKAAAKEAST